VVVSALPWEGVVSAVTVRGSPSGSVSFWVTGTTTEELTVVVAESGFATGGWLTSVGSVATCLVVSPGVVAVIVLVTELRATGATRTAIEVVIAALEAREVVREQMTVVIPEQLNDPPVSRENEKPEGRESVRVIAPEVEAVPVLVIAMV
jgi:hypothetical protein